MLQEQQHEQKKDKEKGDNIFRELFMKVLVNIAFEY